MQAEENVSFVSLVSFVAVVAFVALVVVVAIAEYATKKLENHYQKHIKVWSWSGVAPPRLTNSILLYVSCIGSRVSR